MRPLIDELNTAAAANANGIALIDGARRTTYAEMSARIRSIASLLLASGVQPGNRVGVHLSRSTELVLALYAILQGVKRRNAYYKEGDYYFSAPSHQLKLKIS